LAHHIEDKSAGQLNRRPTSPSRLGKKPRARSCVGKVCTARLLATEHIVNGRLLRLDIGQPILFGFFSAPQFPFTPCFHFPLTCKRRTALISLLAAHNNWRRVCSKHCCALPAPKLARHARKCSSLAPSLSAAENRLGDQFASRLLQTERFHHNAIAPGGRRPPTRDSLSAPLHPRWSWLSVNQVHAKGLSRRSNADAFLSSI
jgi:hypothetical protein